jgi:hypothetical protein
MPANASFSAAPVAVIDSALDPIHANIGSNIVPVYDYGDNDRDATSTLYADARHGTRIASIIAGKTNDAYDTGSVGQQTLVHFYKTVQDKTGKVPISAVAAAIKAATDAGNRIINLSLGYEAAAGVSIDLVTKAAIDYAVERNVLVVAAAGNSGSVAGNPVVFPAAYDPVLSVGGTRANGSIWPDSTFNSHVDISAPGNNVAVASFTTFCGLLDGTSFSAALVSGAAALVQQARVGLSAVQTEAILKSTARDQGAASRDHYGAGVLDAAGAVVKAKVTVPTPLVVAGSVSISGNVTVGGTVGVSVGAWSPSSGVALAYEWYLDGVKVGSQKTFTVPVGALGKGLEVKVVGTRSGYTKGVRLSPRVVVAERVQFAISPSLNGDRFGDVLALWSDGRLERRDGLAGGQISGASVWIATGLKGSRVYAPGDWNGNGKSDVISVDAQGRMFLHAGDGAGKVAGSRQIGNGWGGFRVMPAGDLTRDGVNDILAIKEATGDLFLYAGNGSGGFKSPYPKVGYGWKGFDLYSAGDLTRDGRIDIVSIDSRGNLYAYPGKGTGAFRAKYKVGNGWKGYVLASGGDIDGDGAADIIGRDGVSALRPLYFYRGKGNGGFLAKKLLTNGW